MRVNRDRNDSASRPVHVGDTLTIALESGVRVLRVRGCGERRGPPAEARQLYDYLSPPDPPAVATGERIGGRPGKHERRAAVGLKRRASADSDDDFASGDG